jgi:cell division septum initiation protein DivIVA
MQPDSDSLGHHGWSRHISVAQIRSMRFGRTPLGRRGVNEDEVSGFLLRLAEEVSGLETELTSVRTENARIKSALRDWQSQAGEIRAMVDRTGMPVEAINLLSRAQRQIEAQVAETERYCRLREEEARLRYDEIVSGARQHAKEEAERVVRAYRASAGSRYSPEGERAERTGVWLNALLRSLDALAAHVEATRRSFAVEVEKLTDPSPGGFHAEASESRGTIYTR